MRREAHVDDVGSSVGLLQTESASGRTNEVGGGIGLHLLLEGESNGKQRENLALDKETYLQSSTSLSNSPLIARVFVIDSLMWS